MGAWMFKPRIWLKLGALAVASSATASSKPTHATETIRQGKEVGAQLESTGAVLAQRGIRGAGEAGERGVSTRYICGVTEGADSERAREKEVENDTQGRLEKRSGTYNALQNKTEVELGITNDLLLEVGLFSLYHRIENVPDFEDK